MLHWIVNWVFHCQQGCAFEEITAGVLTYTQPLMSQRQPSKCVPTSHQHKLCGLLITNWSAMHLRWLLPSGCPGGSRQWLLFYWELLALLSVYLYSNQGGVSFFVKPISQSFSLLPLKEIALIFCFSNSTFICIPLHPPLLSSSVSRLFFTSHRALTLSHFLLREGVNKAIRE